MKFISALPFAAIATAFVLPDVQVFDKLAGQVDRLREEISVFDDKVKAALDKHGLPDVGDVRSALEKGFPTSFELALEEELDGSSDEADFPGHHGGHHGHHGHHHDLSNLTIYQVISKSKHTTNFTKLVNEYDDIVELLNSTKADYTLFVPVNSAFEHIPHHGDKKPSREFIEKVLRYHIGLGLHSARDILTTQTVATALDEELLGGEPQRLRTSVGLGGVRVNFYGKIVAANFDTKNGIVHAVDHIIVPPPFVGRELSLFPNVFSTLLLAYEKTDFVKFIHGVATNGSTVFAPTNRAFARLGPRANAFLFNTEKGLGYLKALLKYQIVANTTLYSDAVYTNDGSAGGDGDAHAEVHLDLPTLLHDLPVHVTVKKWGVFVRFLVNGCVRVVVRDGVARNGVVQVVDRIPIPPHKHHGPSWEERGGEIEVEELQARLAEYVEGEEAEAEAWEEL